MLRKLIFAGALLASASLPQPAASQQPQRAPTAPSGSLTLTAGGTSQVLFQAYEVLNGCTITNPQTATEPIWVNFFTTAQAAEGTTSIPLTAGQSIGCGVGLSTAVSWIAATTGHKINAQRF